MREGFVEREKCPVCGKARSKSIFKEFYSSQLLIDYLESFYGKQGGVDIGKVQEGIYELVKCSHCELVYQRYIPNDAMMETLYERWLNPSKVYEKFEKSHNKEYYLTLGDEVAGLIGFFDAKPSDLDFFDFGMGWSNWCKMVQAFGVNVCGTELSQARIDHAKTYGLEIIDLDQLSEKKFDFINTEQVFEHISDPKETLALLVKGLKKNGVIKLSVPNGFDIERRLKVNDWSASKGSINSLNPVAPLEHINCFKTKNLDILADKAGLKRVKVPIPKALNPKEKVNMKEKLKSVMRPIYRTIVPNDYPFDTTYLFYKKK